MNRTITMNHKIDRKEEKSNFFFRLFFYMGRFSKVYKPSIGQNLRRPLKNQVFKKLKILINRGFYVNFD